MVDIIEIMRGVKKIKSCKIYVSLYDDNPEYEVTFFRSYAHTINGHRKQTLDEAFQDAIERAEKAHASELSTAAETRLWRKNRQVDAGKGAE